MIPNNKPKRFNGAKITLSQAYGSIPTQSDNTLIDLPDSLSEDPPKKRFGGAKVSLSQAYGNNPTQSDNTLVDLTDSLSEDLPKKRFGGAKINLSQAYGVTTATLPEKPSVKVKPVIKKSLPPKEKITDEEFDRILDSEPYFLFTPKPKNNTYLIDRNKMMAFDDCDLKTGHHLPLVIDTEFTDKNSKLLEQSPREGLTTQIKGIHKNAPAKIFAHTNKVNMGRIMADVKPFPMIKTIFHPLDYLISEGYDVNIKSCQSWENKNKPNFCITLYGHFLLAEILMIANDSLYERILELLGNKTGERIEMGRRLRCITPIDGAELDYVNLNHFISINGEEFNLTLRLIDTGAIHGIASYKAFCKSVGIILEHKDNFNSKEKEDMLRMAIERWKDFEDYSLGDLETYEALEAYTVKWKEVFKLLDLQDYWQEPKLTIGGSVKAIFESALAHKLEIKDEKGNPWKTQLTEIVNEFIKPTSANDLRQSATSTKALLAKVEGGRCRNNRPTIARLIAEIVDIDISGAYGEGQRNQDYFIGIPIIWEYKSTAKNNDYITLREFLKRFKVPVDQIIKGDWSDWGNLIPGAWIARIGSKEPLKYSQDFFASWFTESGHGVNVMAKFIKSFEVDEDLTYSFENEFDEEYGSLKIFNHEIHNALLQHDGLEWLFSIASPRQRNEMLDKLVVLAAAVYPKSQKINTDDNVPFYHKLAELTDKYAKWTGKNTTDLFDDIDGYEIIRQDLKECHAWLSINLGDLTINNLLIQRKIAQKVYGKKSPLDVLFKLCINTLYGDMVSKFFVTSNTVVGNNITARCRAMAWYMEKGFNGFQSITDGCGFDLNNVIHPGRDEINGECINQHRENSKLAQRMIKTAPLGGCEKITIKWTEMQWTETDEETKEIKNKSKYIPHIQIDGLDLTPRIKGESGEQYIINPGITWIEKEALKHLQNLFPKVSVLHKESTAISITKNPNGQLTPEFIERKGQFSFEIKELYTEASLHGSANYAFKNPNETVFKARGYTTEKRTHYSINGELISYTSDNGVITTDAKNLKLTKRYNDKNNPAKDFLNQLLTNPDTVVRQGVAIKKQILKPSEYRENTNKYDALKIVPGDNIKKSFLMQEFSLSQFTFKTHKQYMMWKKGIEKGKLKNKQSLESYFLNEDGTLNFQKMIEQVDEMIANDVEDPLKHLDKHRNRQRTAKRNATTKQGKEQPKTLALEHPSLKMWQFTRDSLGDISECPDVESED
jgi:hypothetical protein